MNRRRVLAAATAAASIVGLSACAASSSTSASNPSASNPSASTPVTTQGISSGKVITLGLTGPQSGPLAVAGSIGFGALAYFSQLNAQGGVNGYTFKLIRIDDQYDPTQTVTAVRTLWQTDKVFALFEPYGSDEVAAIEQYVNQNNIPVIFPYAANTEMFPASDPAPANAFGINASYSGQVSALVKYATTVLGAKSIAILHTTDDLGMSGVAPAESAAKADGASIVANIGYSPTETNFAPYGQRLASSKADAVIVWAIPGAAQILTAARNSGWQGDIMLNDAFRGGYFETALAAVPGAAGKTYLLAGEDLVTQPGLTNFAATIKKDYPSADTTQALTGWGAAALLAHAVDIATKSGTPLTWTTLAKAFESIQNYSGQGLQDVSFSATNHVGVNSAQMLEFEGGVTFKQVQGFEPLPAS
jgi:branched-chain amino acid transport system substrate-binding protein